LRVGFAQGSGTVRGRGRYGERADSGSSKDGTGTWKGWRQGTVEQGGEVPAHYGGLSLRCSPPSGAAGAPPEIESERRKDMLAPRRETIGLDGIESSSQRARKTGFLRFLGFTRMVKLRSTGLIMG